MYIIIASTISLIIGFIIGRISKSNTEEDLLRRGILNKSFTYKNNKDNLDVQVEIGEIERTKQKSKIRVLNIIFNDTEYDNFSTEVKIKKLLNNSWIDSSTVEWIEDDVAQQRNKKIEKILK